MSNVKGTISLGNGFAVVGVFDNAQKIAKNFTLKEYANNLAKENIQFEITDDALEHIKMLQELRNKCGSLTVNSWYRTAKFNRSVNGSSNSLHLKGLATDISFRAMSDGQYLKIKLAWKDICKAHGKIGGINRYTNGVHVSSREDLLGAKSFVERDYRRKAGDW